MEHRAVGIRRRDGEGGIGTGEVAVGIADDDGVGAVVLQRDVADRQNVCGDAGEVPIVCEGAAASQPLISQRSRTRSSHRERHICAGQNILISGLLGDGRFHADGERDGLIGDRRDRIGCLEHEIEKAAACGHAGHEAVGGKVKAGGQGVGAQAERPRVGRLSAGGLELVGIGDGDDGGGQRSGCDDQRRSGDRERI